MKKIWIEKTPYSNKVSVCENISGGLHISWFDNIEEAKAYIKENKSTNKK